MRNHIDITAIEAKANYGRKIFDKGRKLNATEYGFYQIDMFIEHAASMGIDFDAKDDKGRYKYRFTKKEMEEKLKDIMSTKGW